MKQYSVKNVGAIEAPKTPSPLFFGQRRIVKEDKGRVTDIQCQHPTCKTHPKLRYINWVCGVPIGSCCITKVYTRLDDFLLSEEA